MANFWCGYYQRNCKYRASEKFEMLYTFKKLYLRKDFLKKHDLVTRIALLGILAPRDCVFCAVHVLALMHHSGGPYFSNFES